MITEHRIKRWCYFRRLIAGKQHGFLRFATVLAFAARSKSSRFGYKTSKNWKPKHGYRFSMAERRASEYLLLLLTDIISLRTRTFVTSVENILLWYKILDHGWILTAGTKWFLDRPCTFVRRKPRSIMCSKKHNDSWWKKLLRWSLVCIHFARYVIAIYFQRFLMKTTPMNIELFIAFLAQEISLLVFLF